MKSLDLAKATRAQVVSRLGKGLSLILRTCKPTGESHSGFIWPTKGFVVAPDWSPKAECGFGLHGLLDGKGDADLMDWSDGALWIVAAVETVGIVGLGGKIKFPRAWVLVAGTRKEATDFLLAHVSDPSGVHGVIISVEQKCGATGGRGSVITAGHSGQATAGDSGQAKCGSEGTIAIRWWDGKRYRLAVGYVGENGIKADTFYCCDDSGVLMEARK
jgi:hypothetical protein